MVNQPLDSSAHGGKTLFVLGADGPLGRDELLRVLAGGRVSLEIALFATLIGLAIGVLFGTIAGWYGGSVDALVSRLTELVMAFPLLLLVIAIGQSVADRFDNVTLHGTFEPGVLSLGVVIRFFSWFYPARVCRVLVQELREREFVEAARMIGQSDWRILRKHILPHLLGPVTVWAGLMAASVIVLEAALSSLNFGIRLPTASWGSLLSSTFGNLFNFNPLGGGEPPTPAVELASRLAERGALPDGAVPRARVGRPAERAQPPRRRVDGRVRRQAPALRARDDPPAHVPDLPRLRGDPGRPGLPPRRLRAEHARSTTPTSARPTTPSASTGPSSTSTAGSSGASSATAAWVPPGSARRR